MRKHRKRWLSVFLIILLISIQVYPVSASELQKTETTDESGTAAISDENTAPEVLEEEESEKIPDTDIQTETDADLSRDEETDTDRESELPGKDIENQENSEEENSVQKNDTEQTDETEIKKMEQAIPGITYQTSFQNSGKTNTVSDGAVSGNAGSGCKMEGFSAELYRKEGDQELSGGVRYRLYLQNSGWQMWKSDGSYAGTSGKNIRAEAVQIELTGEIAKDYDVYYRVYSQQIGWLGWAKNGQSAGTADFSWAVEAVRVYLLEKGKELSDKDETAFVRGIPSSAFAATAHIQTYGNRSVTGFGQVIGTTGEKKRMEGLKLTINRTQGEDYPSGEIRYRAHVQNLGWQNWVQNGQMAGTTGRSLRMEAIQIELTGNLAKYYDIYYSAHVQQLGWLGWAKNGQSAGTEAFSYRMEAMKIVLVKKGASGPGTEKHAFYKGYSSSELRYSGHVQNFGNLSEISGNRILGTVGKGLRMEALRIHLTSPAKNEISGGIRYRAHIQNIGWQNWQSDGGLAGTTGRSLRMEAVEIKLTGEIADYYDIYYRTHVQNFGWLGWAKNGQKAGTTGYYYRMEAIQIKLVPKGGDTPVNTGYFRQYTGKKELNVPLTYQNPRFPNGCEAISLYMALRYYGYMLTTNDICYKYLPRGPLHSTNPYSAYMGDPGSLSGGYGCWASVICQCASNYFKAVNVKNRSAKNITGSSLEVLFQYIDKGNPVVVWGTLNMGNTTWFRAGSKNGAVFYWPSRAHCVLLTGYDKNRKVVKVNDPIRGKVEYSFSSFEKAYKTMNRNAMVIQ